MVDQEKATDLGSILNGVLSDPEMLKRAMETAEQLKASGALDGLIPSGKESNSSATEEKKTSEKFDRHRRLLEALLPYLGETRREKADMLLKMLRLLELADGMGALELFGRKGRV